MIWRAFALSTALLASGCSQTVQTLGAAGQSPGYIKCEGKSVVSIIGGGNAFSGINGAVTADCGPGAIIQWGPVPPP